MAKDVDEFDDRLPTFHRTIRIQSELWQTLKKLDAEKNTSLRSKVDDALDAELLPLIDSLRGLGFKGEVKTDKLVRIPVNENIIARINYAKRQTGLPAVALLRICLQKFADKP